MIFIFLIIFTTKMNNTTVMLPIIDITADSDTFMSDYFLNYYFYAKNYYQKNIFLSNEEILKNDRRNYMILRKANKRFKINKYFNNHY